MKCAACDNVAIYECRSAPPTCNAHRSSCCTLIKHTTEPYYVYVKGKGWILQSKPKRIQVAGHNLKPGDKVFKYSYGGVFYEDWPNGVVLSASDIDNDSNVAVGKLSGYTYEVERDD